jgi:hypothetical protein
MPASTPQEIHFLFERAFNTGDVEAILALYEPGAVLVAGGKNILGRPLFVYWSFDTPADQIDKQSIGERLGFIGHVVLHIFDGTRWKRTLHIVR